MNINIKRFLIIFGWIFIFAVVAAYNYFNISLTELVPQCSFLKATGYKCPGCGGTRSVENLLKGNILGSLKYNFIPFIVGGYIFLAFLEYTLDAFTKWRMKIFIFREWLLWSLGSIIIGFWIIRNII